MRETSIRRDRGAGVTEYAALVVIAAVLLGGLLAAGIKTGITDNVGSAICRIFHPGDAKHCTSGHRANPTPTSTGGIDQKKVDDALDYLRYQENCKPGADKKTWSSGVLTGLSQQELDAVLHKLTAGDWKRLLHRSGLSSLLCIGSKPPFNSTKFNQYVLTHASQAELAAIAKWDPQARPPDFDQVGGDGAHTGKTVAQQSKYGKVPGHLFIGGIKPSDVNQQQIGDCWLISSLAEIARQDPSVIKHAIHTNPNGTYTVTFHNPDGSVSHIVVNGRLPLHDGDSIFAGYGDPPSGTNGNEELWPAILEKAYAKWQGGYHKIEGGWPKNALSALTGKKSTQYFPASKIDMDTLASEFDHHQAITVTTTGGNDRTGLYKNGTLVHGHAYYVVGVDKKAGTVTIQNPWGTSYPPITMSYQQFAKNLQTVETNPLGGH